MARLATGPKPLRGSVKATTMTADRSPATITHIQGIALAPSVRRRFYGSYQVPSRTEPGVWHAVLDLDALGTGHGMRCSCPAGIHGRPDCAHRQAVLVARELSRKGLGPRRPAPRPHTAVA